VISLEHTVTSPARVQRASQSTATSPRAPPSSPRPRFHAPPSSPRPRFARSPSRVREGPGEGAVSRFAPQHSFQFSRPLHARLPAHRDLGTRVPPPACGRGQGRGRSRGSRPSTPFSSPRPLHARLPAHRDLGTRVPPPACGRGQGRGRSRGSRPSTPPSSPRPRLARSPSRVREGPGEGGGLAPALDVSARFARTRASFSGIAQLVERSAVNRLVPGSSPGPGAIFLSSPTNGEGRSTEAPKERSEGASPFLPRTPGVSRAARAAAPLSRVLAESAERAR
jgi:hypothetical protein